MTVDTTAVDEVPLETSTPDQDGDFSEAGDISGDGGVIKEILRHGEEGWEKPESGDDVQMHYRGTLMDGTEFDSSYERSTPFSFKLGDGKVIKGWDIVGKTMARGEKARVTLKPEYAYGAAGSPPKIPPDATLVFEMELLSWMSKRNVFGDGSVEKTEINGGEGWERPSSMAEATLEVVATQMEDGGKREGKELFRGESTFSFGCGQVPEAWEKVVPDMKKNAEITLLCKAPRVAGPGVDYVPDDAECVRYWLKLLSWRKIEDIHGDRTLVKKVLKEGDGWERPSEGSVVNVNVKYMLPSPDSPLLVPPPVEGSEVEVESFVFKIGDGVAIDGLDRAVQSMKVNEVAVIRIAPIHAFGSAPALITEELAAKGFTPESTILVEFNMSKFEKAKDVWSMSFEEKVEEMKARKECGNVLYRAKRYGAAKKNYDRAVAFFDSPTSELSSELKGQVNELLVLCHLNLAVCVDKLGDMQKVLTHCKKALEIAPSNVKALYRQGCAYLKLEDYYNAKTSLKYALELSPGNTEVRKKLAELREKRLKQDAEDKRLYSNLFGRMRDLEEKEQKGKTENGTDAATEVVAEKVATDVEMKDGPVEGKKE